MVSSTDVINILLSSDRANYRSTCKAPRFVTLPVTKNTEAVSTVEAIRSALATIPDYLDRSMDMVDILKYSGDELGPGDTLDFVVEQMQSARRHDLRKFVFHEERTE